MVIFVIFILMQSAGSCATAWSGSRAHDLQRTTAALDDAGQRLSRLFLTQLALNAGFGLVIGAGLWVIGVPSAALVGHAGDDLALRPLYRRGDLRDPSPRPRGSGRTGLDHGVVDRRAVSGRRADNRHVIEPLLYGHGTGLSPVAVVASATFWTWLWGPIGLFLATPLTICLVVLGRYVDRLKFLDVMFGDEPALTPAELIYQRMLAGDPVEAAEQARNF